MLMPWLHFLTGTRRQYHPQLQQRLSASSVSHWHQGVGARRGKVDLQDHAYLMLLGSHDP